MSREAAEKAGAPIVASIKGYGSAGVDPSIMGYGPVPSSKKALEMAGWNVGDLDLIEANEAFASQSLAVVRDLGLDPGHRKCQWRRHCPGSSHRMLRRPYPDDSDLRNEGSRRTPADWPHCASAEAWAVPSVSREKKTDERKTCCKCRGKRFRTLKTVIRCWSADSWASELRRF